MTYTQLKKQADKFSWDLVKHTNKKNFLGMRTVVKKQSNALKFNNNCWFYFPPAKEVKMESLGNDTYLLMVDLDEGENIKRVMVYELKLIKG